MKVEDIRMYTESCWKMGMGGKGVRESNGRGWTDQSNVFPSGHTLRHCFEHQLKY
jgi:hypothetical protein